MSFWSALLSILWAFIALVLVLFLAWLALRFLNKRMPGAGTTSNRLMNVLDRVAFGKNNSLILVRVETKVFLIAYSENAIEKIAEFDDPEKKISLPDMAMNTNFSDVLKDVANRLGVKKSDTGSADQTDEPVDQDQDKGGKE